MYLGGPNSGQVVEYVRSFDPRWVYLLGTDSEVTDHGL